MYISKNLAFNDIVVVETLTDKTGNGHYLILKAKVENIFIFMCYKHPDYSNKDFLDELRNQIACCIPANIVLVGDLNMDARGNPDHLQKFFEHFSMRSRITDLEPTTDYGTQIDVCFSNCNFVTASVYETYYSYHKGILVSWN